MAPPTESEMPPRHGQEEASDATGPAIFDHEILLAPTPPSGKDLAAEEPTPSRAPAPPTSPIPGAVAPDDGAEALAQGEPPVLEDFCEIAVWRGYAKSRFYARLEADSQDYEFAVAESPTFRHRGNGMLERTGAAVAAHRALIDALRENGWEAVGEPDPWYANRFRRALSAEPGQTASLVQP